MHARWPSCDRARSSDRTGRVVARAAGPCARSLPVSTHACRFTARVAARTLLEPHLGEFMARYPLLRVELVMDDGLSNIIADGYDAGIRLGESLAEHMVAVPITPMLEMVVAGSPDYFARHGTPATPADLIGHNCLCYRHTTSGAIYRWEFTSSEVEGHAFEVEPQGSVVTNDDDGMIRARCKVSA